MYRLRQHLDSIARGEGWSDVSFRKNDYFVDVASALNSVLHIVRGKLGIETPTATRPEEMKYEAPVEIAKVTEVADAKTAAIDTESDDFKKAS